MDTTQTQIASLSTQLTMADRTALTSRYEVLEEVGRGGMGVVYRARQLALNRTVAVKVCLPGGHIDRFRREGALAARIDSPHVVKVYDFDELPDGRVLLVMQWVDGKNLTSILRNASGALPEEVALGWMRHVCDGMQTAAAEGVIHRDLKPSNILVDGAGVARVADFGLARAPELDELTAPGAVMGTPHYMAPEQAEDPRGADTRSDIYSFGATFYHVLTGHTPFDGPSHFSIMFKHKTEPLVAPVAYNANLSAHLSACLERCMAKAPHERFQSFREVAAQLRSLAPGADPWADDDGPDVRRHLDRYRAHRATYLGDSAALPLPDRYAFSGDRSLSIGFGNLAAEQADALVSSDDELLSMGGEESLAAQIEAGLVPGYGGGVAGALARGAGPGYWEAAQRLAPVRHGRAAVTPAGALPARFVFHAVTISLRNQLRPSRDIINELLESCFYHADTLEVKSIAFPLLGTGVGMLARDVCLDTMVRFLVRKLAHGLTSVHEVRIVVYNRKP